MSRSDEVNKMTENVYKGILDQFNPSLKNFVTMGKHYEKALTGVTVAAKGYFDTLVKLGELASDSQGSKELGDMLFQMAEVHRQIQVQLEDVLKLFHSELLSQLEQKLELDIKYLTATLKKYQSERKSKVESIERCQSQLKKLRRKSQASRHPNKYGDREMQRLSVQEVPPLLNGDSRPQQQQRSSQSVPGLQSHPNPSSNGHAQSASSASSVHSQTAVGVSGLQSPPSITHTSTSSHSSLLGLTPPLMAPHSAPLSRALTPVLLSGSAAAVGVLKAPDLYSTSTLPLPRRQSSETRQGFMGSTLPRVLPLCAPPRVEALFPHSTDSCEAEKPGDRGGSSCLLSFLPGDALSLLISEPRDGWHYGQNERSGRKGWFPFSYTQPFPNTPGQDLRSVGKTKPHPNDIQ
ncbi:brain-specific angiogenesis inhibitor 1-associated protein 2-like [Sinocyclocheilus grahami]|uniref:brain-specific angiogenesis inhibitor 1-associated protein 2-like n=1 Tax=Sinocyclocheilus grahami TaxID=75366 RepID=UPI0007AD03B6|nr:PREDICTED: brain-specific angiogenesis inhibitor 1-associated protein 2-like [Sinocyclocheilus grahami]